MISLPVLIPESNSTVSFWLCWASRILGDRQICSSANREATAPSTWRPPGLCVDLDGGHAWIWGLHTVIGDYDAIGARIKGSLCILQFIAVQMVE